MGTVSDAPADQVEQRTPVGRVWMELVVRLHHATRAADVPRQDTLMRLIDGLEVEFSVETSAERAFWKGSADDG